MDSSFNNASQKKRSRDNSVDSSHSSKESNMESSHRRIMLDCSLCTELFQLDNVDLTPRLLACGHTYCLGCLDNINKPTTQSLTCPECLRNQKYKALEGIDVDLKLIGMIQINIEDNQVGFI